MMQPDIPAQLEQDLLQLIQSEPNGMPEHQLLKQLTELGYQGFAPSLEPLELFQAHFLLFHLLYRLAPCWRQKGMGDLQIDCLSIQFKPLKTADDHALNKADPLQSYYLDYSHYRNTQSDDVVQMLDDFWQQFAGGALSHSNDEIAQAKQILGFETHESLNKQSIQRRFRQLSQTHHPDKGGDTKKFQQLNHATQLLKQVYSD